MNRTLGLLVTASFALSAGAAFSQDRGHGGHDRHHRGGDMGAQLMELYDTNGDGAITQEEIDTARADRLAAFDADGNGTLSLEEYQALWLDAYRERMVDNFQRHDDDGDGAITVEEFGEDQSRLVRRLDRDGDGTLTLSDRHRQGRHRHSDQDDGQDSSDN